MKPKQPRPGFEFEWPIPLATTITVTLSMLPNTCNFQANLFHISTWSTDETLTDTTAPDQTAPRSIGSEDMTSQSPTPKNWKNSPEWSLVSYSEHSFLGDFTTQSVYIRPLHIFAYRWFIENTNPLTKWVEYLLIIRKTGVWSLVVIPKTRKMVLDTYLLNTQHFNVRIKGKMEQSRERSCTFPYASM